METLTAFALWLSHVTTVRGREREREAIMLLCRLYCVGCDVTQVTGQVMMGVKADHLTHWVEMNRNRLFSSKLLCVIQMNLLFSPLEFFLQLLDFGVHLVLGLSHCLQLLPEHLLFP